MSHAFQTGAALRNHGPLTRYVKLRVAHAPGMPGTFPLPPTSKETASLRPRRASWHVCHTRVVMHIGIANQRWQGKGSRHFRRMRNPRLYISGKRLMLTLVHVSTYVGGLYPFVYALNRLTPVIRECGWVVTKPGFGVFNAHNHWSFSSLWVTMIAIHNISAWYMIANNAQGMNYASRGSVY